MRPIKGAIGWLSVRRNEGNPTLGKKTEEEIERLKTLIASKHKDHSGCIKLDLAEDCVHTLKHKSNISINDSWKYENNIKESQAKAVVV